MDHQDKQLGYRTYICGSDALFDKELIETIKRETSMLRVLQGYRSIWRILHVDGFEKPSIPFHTGNFRYFFQYASTANN